MKPAEKIRIELSSNVHSLLSKDDHRKANGFNAIEIILWNKEVKHIKKYTLEEFLHEDPEKQEMLQWNIYNSPKIKKEIFCKKGTVLITDIIFWNIHSKNDKFEKFEVLNIKKSPLINIKFWNRSKNNNEKFTEEEVKEITQIVNTPHQISEEIWEKYKKYIKNLQPNLNNDSYIIFKKSSKTTVI